MAVVTLKEFSPNLVNTYSQKGALHAFWIIFKSKWTIISRYKGFLIFEMIFPTIFAAIPIIMGIAFAGSIDAARGNFMLQTGTRNFVSYMVIGSGIYFIVNTALWNFGMQLRWDQQSGVLESYYLTTTPVPIYLLACGLYALTRSSISFVIGFMIACAIFQVDPTEGDLLFAILFLIVGILPIYGLSFVFGAIILRYKQAWILRKMAYGFPPSWVTTDVRASLLGLEYYLGSWWADLSMLAFFGIIFPIFGYYFYNKIETASKKNAGLGQF
jgi:ABC-2 type transport system permease protein